MLSSTQVCAPTVKKKNREKGKFQSDQTAIKVLYAKRCKDTILVWFVGTARSTRFCITNKWPKILQQAKPLYIPKLKVSDKSHLRHASPGPDPALGLKLILYPTLQTLLPRNNDRHCQSSYKHFRKCDKLTHEADLMVRRFKFRGQKVPRMLGAAPNKS